MKHACVKLITAAAALLGAGAAQAQPVIVDLPARPVWCVSSQPVVVEESQGPTFGAVLFNALYSRLERAALQQEVSSLGIPFADTLAESASAGTATPAAALSASAPTTPSPRYVLRVCANVPSGLTKPVDTLRVEAHQMQAVRAYAALCDAKDETPCRETLKARVQGDLKLTSTQAEAIEWQVAQPLSEAPGADALRAALTDYKARPLVKDVPVPQLPQGKLILWAPIPTGK